MRSVNATEPAGVLGHLAEQSNPGVRHHALAVRADHDPTYPLATFTRKVLALLVDSDRRKPEFPKQNEHFRVPRLRVSQIRVKHGG